MHVHTGVHANGKSSKDADRPSLQSLVPRDFNRGLALSSLSAPVVLHRLVLGSVNMSFFQDDRFDPSVAGK